MFFFDHCENKGDERCCDEGVQSEVRDWSVTMPHVSSGSGGDDLGSTDEVKVFKDEGDGEDEKRSSENLTEEKSSLIDLTESEVRT